MIVRVIESAVNAADADTGAAKGSSSIRRSSRTRGTSLSVNLIK